MILFKIKIINYSFENKLKFILIMTRIIEKSWQEKIFYSKI